MAARRISLRRILFQSVAMLILALAGAAMIWRDDIISNALDPKEPFQTYNPPPAPDYASRAAWALMPAKPQMASPDEPSADIFFLGPTTYEGGKEWNAPIEDGQADAVFRRVMAPNYAGPFVRVGRIFAPRYRQASLYTMLTLREDAREARRFAYGDVVQAFRAYRDHYNQGRPVILVGVEQGGVLAARLLNEEIAGDPALRKRLVAAYLIETLVPAGPVPACAAKRQTGCLAAWASVQEREDERARIMKERALAWGSDGQWTTLAGRTPVCFNPLLGAASFAPAPARLNLGSTNATGLEWGARPAFLARQVGAQCVDGVLRVSRPKSTSLRRSGSWADRRRVPGYNLFYANLEADAMERLATMAPAKP